MCFSLALSSKSDSECDSSTWKCSTGPLLPCWLGVGTHETISAYLPGKGGHVMNFFKSVYTSLQIVLAYMIQKMFPCVSRVKAVDVVTRTK